MASKNSSTGAIGYIRLGFRRWVPWIILAVLGLGPLFACALIGPINLGGDLGLKAAPDWSRGLHIGTGSYGLDSGAPLAVDSQHKAHLVWTVRLSADEYDLHYARLDSRGVVEEEHGLTIGLLEPRRVRLLLDSQELIHVVLLALPERGEPSSLFHMTLNGGGWLEGVPTLVSSGDSPCMDYDVTVDSGGMIHLFWTETRGADSGLFHSTLSSGPAASATPQLLATGVSHPVAGTDRNGGIHLLWEKPDEDDQTEGLYHAILGDALPPPLSGTKLLVLPTRTTASRAGPVLALDDKYAYLVWTMESRLGRFAPSASEGWYGSFRLDAPSAASGRRFLLPMDEWPTYALHDSPYNYEYLVPSAGDTLAGSDLIAHPSALDTQGEAMVTFSMAVMRGLARESQIVNVTFADGRLIGYQLACNTTHWSRLPNMTSDSNGNLHLSWVDGLEPGPSEVYYATTSPSVRGRVDHITSDDLLLAALNTAFNAAAGVAMIPFIVLWVVPSLLWVFISGFFLGEAGVRSRRGYLALAISWLVYQLGKLYFTPALLDYVPFSVSVPFLPAHLYALLQVLVPVCIVAVGTTAVLYTMLRVETRSLFTVALAFILPDAFLMMVVYGPGFALLG